MSRKKISKKRLTSLVCAQVTKDFRERVEKFSEDNMQNISVTVRKALDAYMKMSPSQIKRLENK